MVSQNEIVQALGLLDDKVGRAQVRVTEAEASLREAITQLDEAKAERKGADAFVTLLRTTARDNPSALSGSGQLTAGVPRGVNTGLTGVLEQVVRDSPGVAITVDDVMANPQISEMTTDRDQVRNGLHYLARRRHVLENVGRGKWRLHNAEAPVAAGASDSEEPNSGSSWEEGGTDDDSALLRGRVDSAVGPQVSHGHAGLRAPIGGEEPA